MNDLVCNLQYIFDILMIKSIQMESHDLSDEYNPCTNVVSELELNIFSRPKTSFLDEKYRNIV